MRFGCCLKETAIERTRLNSVALLIAWPTAAPRNVLESEGSGKKANTYFRRVITGLLFFDSVVILFESDTVQK